MLEDDLVAGRSGMENCLFARTVTEERSDGMK